MTVVYTVTPKRYIVQAWLSDCERGADWSNQSRHDYLADAINEADSWQGTMPDTQVRVVDSQTEGFTQ